MPDFKTTGRFDRPLKKTGRICALAACCEPAKSIGFPAENSPNSRNAAHYYSVTRQSRERRSFGTPPNGDRHRRAADLRRDYFVVIRAEQRILSRSTPLPRSVTV